MPRLSRSSLAGEARGPAPSAGHSTKLVDGSQNGARSAVPIDAAIPSTAAPAQRDGILPSGLTTPSRGTDPDDCSCECDGFMPRWRRHDSTSLLRLPFLRPRLLLNQAVKILP